MKKARSFLVFRQLKLKRFRLLRVWLALEMKLWNLIEAGVSKS